MPVHPLVAGADEPPIESKPPNSFRRFNGSPEIIRRVGILYVLFPLWPRNVEDLLARLGIDLHHKTISFWWNRFCHLFTAARGRDA